MTDSFAINYVNKKVEEATDKNYIRFTYYDLKIKNNLTEIEIDKVLDISRNFLINNGYDVYFTGAKFTYKDYNITVQSNELLIAVKR